MRHGCFPRADQLKILVVYVKSELETLDMHTVTINKLTKILILF